MLKYVKNKENKGHKPNDDHLLSLNWDVDAYHDEGDYSAINDLSAHEFYQTSEIGDFANDFSEEEEFEED